MIETWEAQRFEKVLDVGRTRPLVVDCAYYSSASSEEETSESPPDHRLMVVKSVGHPEVTETSLFCEVFGNLLARELGVATPTPALVNLSPEFVQAVSPLVAEYGISLTPSLGSGCEYLHGGLTPAVPGAFLTQEEVEQATLIYGFDLLVQNPDRRWDRPNCASLAGSLIAFDFERSFSFLLPIIGGLAPPWEVSRHGIGANHLFYSILKAKAPSWTPLIVRLRALTAERLEQLASALPGAWQSEAARVREHITEVIMNLPQFELELQRSLL
ncbi:MAG: hypothetical protein AABO41_08115 [Acidobacteriota bacterium]